LVSIADYSGDTIGRLHKLIDVERQRNTKLVEANLRLEKELEQAKLELKLERQTKFATNQQKEDDSADDASIEAREFRRIPLRSTAHTASRFGTTDTSLKKF